MHLKITYKSYYTQTNPYSSRVATQLHLLFKAQEFNKIRKDLDNLTYDIL